ncbi:MAG: hypothetical protein DRP67_01655 [Candidatus Omnitrophota bacterium]|nr:MAG: hypothetical protein DRP67_01655 [Candidatus Omnitrophota bacterium]
MVYFWIYDFIIFLFIIFFFPFIWRRIKPEKDYPFDWKERIGLYPEKIKEKSIWFQTVSVGELFSITPLIKKIREKYPDERIIITVTTKTGRKICLENFPQIKVFFFPFDFSLIIRRALHLLNPKLIVLVETEIWPNLLRFARRKGIPVIMINGRISPKSFSGYKKFRFFSKKVLPLLTEIAMRTEEEARRIIYLGAEKEKVKVVGSIKFDQAFSLSKKISPESIRNLYGIPEDKRIVVFGSLHPGEEAGIVKVVKRILEKYKDVLCVIAPRFLDRTNIFKILEDEKMEYGRRSKFPENKDCNLWIIDTYGELNNFYAICEFAFVGGSLIRWGGQNPIEPAAFRKPVLFGKYNWHFFEEWKKIKGNGGGIEVEDYEDLYTKICWLLDNPEEIRIKGEKAYRTVLENTGATLRNLEIIEKYLQV